MIQRSSLIAALGLLFAGCSSIPAGKPGPEADRLAREMVAAVNGEAWKKTGAVRWRFAGRTHHLWDRDRQLVQVEWGEVKALVDIDRRCGRVWEEAEEITGPDAAELLDDAHAHWTNDAFWLNPVVKVFDAGVIRERVTEEEPPGERGLIVRFSQGGRTPGDVYVWWVGIDGTPRRWQMWTSNIPIGGMEATWDEWIRLATGARISTKHETALIDILVTEVEGAYTLGELVPGPDPFAPLLGTPGCTPFP